MTQAIKGQYSAKRRKNQQKLNTAYIVNRTQNLIHTTIQEEYEHHVNSFKLFTAIQQLPESNLLVSVIIRQHDCSLISHILEKVQRHSS